MSDIDLKALFIGDKAENGDVFKAFLGKLVDEHLGWRENYIPDDLAAISVHDRNTPSFAATRERVEETLRELSSRLRAGSVPWNSAGRYLGHMNTETLMPSILAYTFAMLWNPNNVALESSMATSRMEAEVGEDLAALFGFDDGWAHICADGSLANLEGLWYARCIKSIPLALKEALPDKVAGKSEWELLNMSTEDILSIIEGLEPDEIDLVKSKSSRSGRHIDRLGVWVVPQTKHYSWVKALDICGVGLDRMVPVPVLGNYRMDVDALGKTLRGLAAKRTPILGVVAVVGSTEEGAVDSVDRIAALRRELMKEGVFFHLHVDAAYGGYARSLFRDADGGFADYEALPALFAEHSVFSIPVEISRDVYEGYRAISEADTVTVDPHKMGYVPYAAGGIAIKHRAMRDIISYFAAYVFEKSTAEAPDLLGAYILEGSKAGATAAAVWTAHRVLPLNVTGYGRLMGASIEAARRFRDFIGGLTFEVSGRTFEAYPLNDPDFNMVDWVFREKGCDDLEEINRFNELMFDYSSYMDTDVYTNRFITSHTTFAREDYGDSPLPFVEKMGLPKSEWERVGQVTLLRAAIMTPYMADDKVFAWYSEAVRKAVAKKIEVVLEAEGRERG
jgi:tyrosine decarboxylase